MRQAMLAVTIAGLTTVLGCGPDAGGAVGRGAEPLGAAPATCAGGAEVSSDRALVTNGGGCYPVGVDAGGLDLFPLVDPEWAPVVNGSSVLSTPVLLSGTVIDARVSNTDFPTSHRTLDQNTDIVMDPDESGCLATGNVTGPENQPVPHLELEWETGSYPPWAWAGVGDRIVTWGRWIFDCGHPDPVPGKCQGTSDPCVLPSDCGGGACQGATWNYRSEMHPPQAVAVIRSGSGAVLPVPGGSQAVPATRADVFVSGDGSGAGDRCVLTHRDSILDALLHPCAPFLDQVAYLPESAPALNGADFEFDVPLPPGPRGGRPVWQIVPQPDMPQPLRPTVRAAIDVTPVRGPDPHLHVVVRMTQPVGGLLPNSYAGTLLAGWFRPRQPEMTHVRVTLQGIDVRDPLKLPLQIPNPLEPTVPLCLELADGWSLFASVNGRWQQLAVPVPAPGPATMIGPCPSQAGSQDHRYPLGAAYDVWLPQDGRLVLHSQATSLSCQDVIRGLGIDEVLQMFPGALDQQLLLAFLCGTSPDPNAGEVDATFAGPTFGARDAPYELASDVGAYALQVRIERIDDQ